MDRQQGTRLDVQLGTQLDVQLGMQLDGRSQLQQLAVAIGGASKVDAAWAGSGEPMDIRKGCGICGEHQPVRVPFLRHVCRGCAAIWVPGICGDCAHTSVTFTLDGQLSRFATCGCGGKLRQVAYVPRPREHVEPEVAQAKAVVAHRRKERAKLSTRTVLVFVTVLAVLGCVQFVRAYTGGSSAPAPVSAQHPQPQPHSTSLTPAQQGRAAAARLTSEGQGHDAFSCAAQLPASIAPVPVATQTPTQAQEETPGNAGSTAFVAACLAG